MERLEQRLEELDYTKRAHQQLSEACDLLNKQNAQLKVCGKGQLACAHAAH